MARGARANSRMLLIGACVLIAGYGSGQEIALASPTPGLLTVSVPVPTVSVPVPTVSVPVPTVSVPVPPTVPTLPTPTELPPTTSVPTTHAPRPPADSLGGSQASKLTHTGVSQSPPTATRVHTRSRRSR